MNGIDPDKHLLPVIPGAHFMMGGIKTDEMGQTTIKGLFAVGEAACTGVHGANRLASNSLLEAIVFGHKTAEAILTSDIKLPKNCSVLLKTNSESIILPTKQEIKEKMIAYAGIERNEISLKRVRNWLESFDFFNITVYDRRWEEIEIVNMLTVAWLIVTSALERKESIGSHYRTDYPKTPAKKNSPGNHKTNTKRFNTCKRCRDMNKIKLKKMLEAFFIEDIGERDITSDAIFPINEQVRGVFIAKENGVIAGLDIMRTAYQLLDPTIEVHTKFKDGERAKKGEAIAEVLGPVRYILTGERLILNLLQRMSGIATLTKKCVEALNDPTIYICDTRKTVPGLKMLDKYAVTCGGGKNHRFGLYDGIMIKDNHIAYCGSITKAVHAVRERCGHMVKVEVETETQEEVLEAIEAGADVIMFDNRTPEEVREFTKLVPNHIITEASGGITLDNIAMYAHTGVDYISLGFLTHSVKALDICLQVDKGVVS